MNSQEDNVEQNDPLAIIPEKLDEIILQLKEISTKMIQQPKIKSPQIKYFTLSSFLILFIIGLLTYDTYATYKQTIEDFNKKINQCEKDYKINHCSNSTRRVKAIEKYCVQWENCIKQQKNIEIGKLVIEVIGKWINCITGVIGYKGALIGAVFFVISLLGAALGQRISLITNKTKKKKKQQGIQQNCVKDPDKQL